MFQEMYLARTYVMVGDYDKAIERLEVLVSPPSLWSMRWLEVVPFLDPLRDHPRFQALLQQYADEVEH